MKSLINKNKRISKQRKEFVEHNFEAMVGARKRRYSDTSQQKQRTEFFEDYYLLYTRIKDQWQKLKEWLDRVFQIYLNESDHKMMSIYGTILDKMQELEGEDE